MVLEPEREGCRGHTAARSDNHGGEPRGVPVIRSSTLFVLALGLTLAAPTFAGAALPEGATIEKKVKAKKTEKLIVGTWNVELPPQIQRSLQIARAALEQGGDDAFEALEPTDEEREMYQTVQLGLAMAGDDAEALRTQQLADLEAAASGMTFTVTPTDLSVTVGDETQTASWSPVRTENNLLVMKTSIEDEPASEVEVRFIHADRLMLSGPNQDHVFLVRK